MNSNLDYEQKYLKYKEKYNELKNQTGGNVYGFGEYVFIYPASINVSEYLTETKYLKINLSKLTDIFSENSFYYKIENKTKPHAYNRNLPLNSFNEYNTKYVYFKHIERTINETHRILQQRDPSHKFFEEDVVNSLTNFKIKKNLNTIPINSEKINSTGDENFKTKIKTIIGEITELTKSTEKYNAITLRSSVAITSAYNNAVVLMYDSSQEPAAA
jgi:hypothetical protein